MRARPLSPWRSLPLLSFCTFSLSALPQASPLRTTPSTRRTRGATAATPSRPCAPPAPRPRARRLAPHPAAPSALHGVAGFVASSAEVDSLRWRFLFVPLAHRSCFPTPSLPRSRFNYFTGSPTMGATGYDGCAPYTSWYCVTDPFHPGGDPDSDGCRKCAGLLQQCSDTGKEPMLYKIKSFGAHCSAPRAAAAARWSLPARPESKRRTLIAPLLHSLPQATSIFPTCLRSRTPPSTAPSPPRRAPRLFIASRPPLAGCADARPSACRPRQVRARELYMMKEIYTNGPIMACIFDYDNWNDFYNQCVTVRPLPPRAGAAASFSGATERVARPRPPAPPPPRRYPLGVYNNTEGSIPTGGHCMNLLGWGVDRLTGMKYWLLRNSWGSGWGSVGVVRGGPGGMRRQGDRLVATPQTIAGPDRGA